MEHLENDIIKKKIDSIDSLPHELESTINSKFELLVAATSGIKYSQSNKRQLISLFLAACSLCFLWLNTEQSSTLKPIINQSPIKKSVVPEQNIVSPGIITKKLKSIDILKTNSAGGNKENSFVLNEQHIVSIDTNSTVVQIESNPVLPVNNDTVSIAIVKPVQQKIKKHRFIEIDFGDNSKTEYINNLTASHKPNFSFQLQLKENIVQSVVPKKNLSYKKVFQQN